MDDKSLEELFDGSDEEVITDEVEQTSQESETVDDTKTIETATDEEGEAKPAEPETEETEPTAEITQDSEETKDHTVPIGTLTAERKKAKERYQAQTEELARERAEFAAFKQQQQNKPLETQGEETPVDDSELMFEDPVAYKAKLMADIKSEITGVVQAEQQDANLKASYAKAQQDHGAEYMQSIMDELTQPNNVNLMTHLSAQPDPVGAAIKWKKDNELLGQFGTGGIEAYKAQLKTDALADIRKQAGYTDPSGGQQTDNLVPSLTDIPAAGGEVVQTVQEIEDETFEQLFGA